MSYHILAVLYTGHLNCTNVNASREYLTRNTCSGLMKPGPLKFPPETQSLQMFMEGIDYIITLETKQTSNSLQI